MSQTTGYNLYSDAAVAGQLADVGPHRIDSFAAEEVIEFGYAVVRGTDPENQCKLPEDGDKPLGIAVFSQTRSQGFSPASTPSSVAANYKVGDTVSVVRQGRVHGVARAVAVAAGDDVYMSVDDAGMLTNAAKADDNTTDNIGPVGKFAGSTSASGGLVAVDLTI